ncbi:molybdopterin-dependent oxidoreductase [Paraburkholderia sp.]|uniref:molybdopterin-dependent oxidoreductase n=1 Tax=Paraburkholderia sp. TaxID=1926495 RepID=UPI0039E401A8
MLMPFLKNVKRSTHCPLNHSGKEKNHRAVTVGGVRRFGLPCRSHVYIVWLSLMSANAAHADPDLLQLDVDGNIEYQATSPHNEHIFTREELLAMPVHAIQSSTNWTGSELWEGPLLTDVLKKAGIRGSTIRVFAYDDYSQEIPLAFIRKYEPILAYRENGRELTLKDFGPLFIIFPRDQYRKELSTITNTRRFVFQIRRIEVK